MGLKVFKIHFVLILRLNVKDCPDLYNYNHLLLRSESCELKDRCIFSFYLIYYCTKRCKCLLKMVHGHVWNSKYKLSFKFGRPLISSTIILFDRPLYTTIQQLNFVGSQPPRILCYMRILYTCFVWNAAQFFDDGSIGGAHATTYVLLLFIQKIHVRHMHFCPSMISYVVGVSVCADYKLQDFINPCYWTSNELELWSCQCIITLFQAPCSNNHFKKCITLAIRAVASVSIVQICAGKQFLLGSKLNTIIMYHTLFLHSILMDYNVPRPVQTAQVFLILDAQSILKAWITSFL